MATKRSARRPAGAPHIRVVGDGERAPVPASSTAAAEVPSPEPAPEPDPQPAKAEPKTLLEAVAGGNYQEILEAQVRDIVGDLKTANGQAKAALHGRLMTISKEIEAIKVATPGNGKSVVATTSDESWDSSAI